MSIIQNPEIKEVENLFCHAIFEKEILVHDDNSLPLAKEISPFLNDSKKQEADHHQPLTSPDFFYEKEFEILVLGFSLPPSDSLLKKLKLHFITLREYFSFHQQEQVFTSARARSLLMWKSRTKFCPNCGKRLFMLKNLTALECSRCNMQYFPRIEPCVIVLVRREEKMLLVRHCQRNQDIFACIAGFIEAGETAEQAAVREVREETGIEIKNLKYKGSQGWPFPDQLMLAFTADYAGGQIRLQESEISEAGWFTPDNLPECPKPGSVAYRLINDLF